MARSIILSTTVLAVSGALATAHAQSASTASDATPSAAGTTDELQEIVVTAERRTADAQKVPATVVVRSGDLLRDQGRTTVQDILEDIPNVTVNTGNLLTSGQPTDNPAAGIVIRGVPTQGGGPGQITVPSTGYYVDGVYDGIGGDYDVNRLEVLEGPQGTLYGRSATGGVVALYTNNPVIGKFSGDGSIELSDFGGGQQGIADHYSLLGHEQGDVNLPVTDQMALRVSASQYDMNGYIDANGGAVHQTEARAKLLIQPTTDLSVLLGAAYEKDLTGSGGLQLTGYPNQVDGWTENGVLPVYDTTTIRHQYWAKVDWTTPYGTLTYQPAYHDYTSSGNSIPVFFIEQVLSEPFDQYTTQEFRFSSLEGSSVNWTVGALYYHNGVYENILPHYVLSNAVTFSQYLQQDTVDIGGFGEATYALPFLPALSITGGLRYDTSSIHSNEALTQNETGGAFPPGPTFGLPENLVTGTVGGEAGHTSASNVTYKLRVSYDITPTNMVYVMNATGFLPGNVNIAQAPNNTVAALRYGQERLSSYEIGTKNRLFNNTLQANGAIFYYNYAGYQQNVNLGSKFPGDPPDNVILTTPARMYGLELQLQYLLTANDRLSLDFGHIHSSYVDESTLFSTNLANKSFPLIPPTTLSASYTHTWNLPGGSTLEFYDQFRYAEASYNGYTQAYENIGGVPYSISPATYRDDISLGWNSASSKYGITFYVHNVNNQVVNTSAIQTVNQGQTGQQIIRGVNLTTPRTVGLVLRASF